MNIEKALNLAVFQANHSEEGCPISELASNLLLLDFYRATQIDQGNKAQGEVFLFPELGLRVVFFAGELRVVAHE